MPLDIAARRKRSISMKKNKAKIAAGRRRAAMKTPTRDVYMKRATKRARTVMMKKLARGKDLDSLAPAQKAELEKKLNKKKAAINKLAQKILVQMRQE